MEIYIGKDGQVLGPYYPDEIQTQLDADVFDGTELAWHKGLEAWVNVKELLEGVAEPAPETKEPSVETESDEEPEPMDDETLGQVNKIKELIADGHGDIAWQLVRSLNNPRIYEGLLEGCPVNDGEWVDVPEYLSENGDLFIKLLVNLPELAKLQPELNPPTKLILLNNQITAQQIDELQQIFPECDIISKIWEFEGYAKAIGSDGTVYVESSAWDNNKLYAINGKSGAKLWEFEMGHGSRSSPAIGSDGTVYVGSSWILKDNHKLYAINGKSGAKLWEFETGDGAHDLAIGSDGTVYFGSWAENNNKLYAINGKSGIKLWKFETGGQLGPTTKNGPPAPRARSTSPVIGSDGTVYVRSDLRKLYAINGKSGAKLWEFETGGHVPHRPAIGSDGTVYVGSHDKKLYAINGKSGVKLWEFETGGWVRSSPAIGSDGTVYVGSDDNNLYAINGKTGVKLWEFETGSWDHDLAIGSDGTVYVGSDALYAINGKSGVKLWEFKMEYDVRSSPAIGSDGTVYVGSYDNKLYAINGKSGAKLWEFETRSNVSPSPAIGSDGTVYVGSDDNNLYAIKT